MGSFRLPNEPASKSAPPPAGSRAGSAAATLPRTVPTSAATIRAPSRPLRIPVHRRVNVLEQPHVLRAHLDLHAAAAHVEGAPVDGHVAGRGDQVAPPVVG